MSLKNPKKSLQELTLLDRFLFAEAMEDPENMKILLDIILEDDIHLDLPPQTEKELRKSSLKRYAKIDVWAKDSLGTVYDTEVQNRNTHNLPKRTRYYQAMIDCKLLSPGETDFNKLNPAFIIVIAPFDLFGYGLYRYTFVGQCLEVPGLALEDGATRIFLNTGGTNDADVSSELIQLLHYIENTNDGTLPLESKRLHQLQQNVKSVQDNEEVGVRYMQLWEEFELERMEARAEGRAVGLAEGREEGLAEGREAGLAEGREAGLAEGREEGLAEGREAGLAEGREVGLAEGREVGLAEGREVGLAEGREVGLAEGREVGLAEGRILSIFECLEDLGNISTPLKEKISTQRDTEILKNWLKKATKATSIAEFEEMIGISNSEARMLTKG